jgi:periplasmic divalent cation tolerance protein
MIQIQWTCATLDEARRISTHLIQSRLVACANIHPIESLYLWNNALENTQEFKVLLKTRPENYPHVRDYIASHCSYTTPEISALPIPTTNAPFLSWLLSSTN